MRKYIDADELLKSMVGIADGWISVDNSFSYEKLVKEFPAADVEPVVHAHYIVDFLGDSSCSQCGEKFLDSTCKRCPNCGAHMDEPEDTTDA